MIVITSNVAVLLLFVMALLLFLGLVAVLHARTIRHDHYRLRVMMVQRGAGIDTANAGADVRRRGLLGLVGGLGDAVAHSGLLSRRTLDEFQHTLVVAGFRSRYALSLLVGGKLLMVTALPALTWALLRQVGTSSTTQIYVSGAVAILGLLIPDFIIRQLRKRHLMALENGLADALDLLVICSQAGLGLEPGLERVGTEIKAVHPAVAEELMHTSQEMRVNPDRRLALINMGKRTGIESLRRLGSTMVQSMQYGTPLSDALRMLSAELRQEALNRFEAKAGRLSVLLTLPMVAFILPCVFLVVGGPAIVQVIQLFRHHH